MTLKQLEYVLTVADIGSISEAAKKLFIAQPSLTTSIRELEEEVDIKIFLRNNKGIVVTNEGEEFLGYARQVIEQMNLLEEKYLKGENRRILFSVSSQHYSFAINAFVDLVKEFRDKIYDFTLRETQTYEIIHDVAILKSEVGVLYTCSSNEEIITKLINKNGLNIEELFTVRPHIFINASHPLADRKKLTFEDMDEYPYLSYEQGENNSFYFSEEIMSHIPRPKNIKVRDRATLFNLLIGLDGYTVSSGIASKELNGENIISVPLDVDEYMKICVITRKNINLSKFAIRYIEILKQYVDKVK